MRRVAIADAEIAAEQLDHGPVARGLAVGHRSCLEDQPLLDAVRVRQLEGEARLAHAGLAHDGGHLSAAVFDLLDRAVELRDLGIAAHEAREPARGGNL